MRPKRIFGPLSLIVIRRSHTQICPTPLQLQSPPLADEEPTPIEVLWVMCHVTKIASHQLVLSQFQISLFRPEVSALQEQTS